MFLVNDFGGTISIKNDFLPLLKYLNGEHTFEALINLWLDKIVKREITIDFGKIQCVH